MNMNTYRLPMVATFKKQQGWAGNTFCAALDEKEGKPHKNWSTLGTKEAKQAEFD